MVLLLIKIVNEKMARYQIDSENWTQITSVGEKLGSIYCESGKVVLAENTALPTTDILETEKSATMKAFESKFFFGVGVTKFIYAIAIGKNAQITVSVGE